MWCVHVNIAQSEIKSFIDECKYCCMNMFFVPLGNICFASFDNLNHGVCHANTCSGTVTGRSLTLSDVEPRRLREAVYDELEGLGCGAQCLGQFLDTAGPNLALHTLLQACTPDLVCTPTHEGQKAGNR